MGLGLLAVIIVVVLIIVRPGSTTPAPTPTPTPTSSGAAEGGATEADTEAGAGASGLVACDPAKVTLEPMTDATDYQAGVAPQLWFTMKSTMTEPCSFAAGSDLQKYVITSGDEVIWSSTDCQTDPQAATTTLQPGVPKEGPRITWDRTRSSPDTCDVPGEQVTAGGASYHLEVAVGDVESPGSRQFLLY